MNSTTCSIRFQLCKVVRDFVNQQARQETQQQPVVIVAMKRPRGSYMYITITHAIEPLLLTQAFRRYDICNKLFKHLFLTQYIHQNTTILHNVSTLIGLHQLLTLSHEIHDTC